MAIDYDMYSEDWTPGEVLESDGNGARLREILDALHQGQRKFRAVLDKGVTPAEFETGKALLAGFDAAAAGLQRSWNKRHKHG